MLRITGKFRTLYPNARMGLILVENIDGTSDVSGLEKAKRQLTYKIREKYGSYTKQDLKEESPIREYMNYYRSFKKTYHVLHQLESVAKKGKEIPSTIPLVSAMFMAELKNLLLTAGHDWDKINGDLTLDIGQGNEIYTAINQEEKKVTEQDMFLKDDSGVISSVIAGPDHRTRITEKTRNALFSIYAPEGIDSEPIMNHLKDIYYFIRLFSPNTFINSMDIHPLQRFE